MTEKAKRQDRRNGFRTLGMILPSLPHLMFRFGRVFLKFKREAKKGGKIFQKELVRQGLDATTAAALTDIYLESSNLMQYMKVPYGETLLKEGDKDEVESTETW